MIKSLKSFGRPLVGKESIFINQNYRVYVQFALQVENPNDLQLLLKKIKNATSGLYIKSDGFNLLPNLRKQSSITIQKIPNEVKTLSDCCDWMYHTYTPDVEYALASIAADETRIVVNSNHALTDGGFYEILIQDLQNPSSNSKFERKAPIPSVLRDDLLKKEFDDFLKNKGQYIHQWPSFNTNDITHLNTQEICSLPDSYNLVPHRFKYEMNCDELSPHIYDKNTQKVNHMSEFLWTGLCLSISAKNEVFGPICVETVMDFRRLIDKNRVDFKFGNTYTNFALCIKNPKPHMTIGQICSEFRNNFNLMKLNDWFYKEFLYPIDYRRDFCPAAHVSNVGPTEIKSPIKDLYMQVSAKELGARSYMQVTSYSKHKRETGENDFILHMGYSPLIVSKKNASDIFMTFIHFLKMADPEKKSGDVLDELIHFQKSLS